MPVRHQLLAVGYFDSDCVRARLRGLTHDDRQPNRWWECRERFPIHIFGHDAFEYVLPGLVSLNFASLSTRHGTGFLRHTILLSLETTFRKCQTSPRTFETCPPGLASNISSPQRPGAENRVGGLWTAPIPIN